MAPRISRWILNNLIWDPNSSGFWAARKLLLALAISAVLDWHEWTEHHPPEIALIAVIHFVFVLASIALVVYTWQRFHSNKKSLSNS